jgi:hypothetical protein
MCRFRSPHVTFIHIDCWTEGILYVYLLGINAVVAVQAGQLTDPECRAIPSLVAAVVAMAGGIPAIQQFRPHEEVSYQDDSPVFAFCFCVYLSGFFPVSVTVLRIRDPGSGGAFLTPGFEMGKIWIRDPGWKKFGSGINIPDPQQHPGFATLADIDAATSLLLSEESFLRP